MTDFRVTKDSKTSEMKYRIKLQEQENLILYLKNQAESLENRYMENLNKMRKEVIETQENCEKQKNNLIYGYEEKIRKLEENLTSLERKYEMEITKNKAFEEEIEGVKKKKVSIEKEFEEKNKNLKEYYENKNKNHDNALETITSKFEEFKKRTRNEHEQTLALVKKEAENSVGEMRKEIEEKMQKIKILEEEVVKERLGLAQKESQLNFLLKAKEEENEKSY